MAIIAKAYNTKQVDDIAFTKADKTALAATDAELTKFKESGIPIGSTMWWHNRALIPAGWIPADGQLLLRAQYPDLFEHVKRDSSKLHDDNNWWGNAALRGNYTLGMESNNFRVPDLNGKQAGSRAVVLRGDGNNSAINNGDIQSDAIRNITGSYWTAAYSDGLGSNISAGFAGAFSDAGRVSGTISSLVYDAANSRQPHQSIFDASRSVPTANENRMVNATGCFIIRAYGAIHNLGSMDAVQLQQSISAVDARATQNANAIAANVTVTNSNSNAINVTSNRVGTIEGQMNHILNNRFLPSHMTFARQNTVNEGGNIVLEHPTDTNWNINIDQYTLDSKNYLRFFEAGGAVKGAFLNLTKQLDAINSQIVTCNSDRPARFEDNGGSIYGWRKLPDGYIEQWGMSYVDGFESEFWVKFHFPFPVELCSVQLGTNNYGGFVEVDLGYQLMGNYNKTGMSVLCNRWGGGAYNNCMWRVLGR